MEPIEIVAGETRLTLAADRNGKLRQLYFGPTGSALPDGAPRTAYPTWGDDETSLPALRVTHADGVRSTRLVLEGVEVHLVEGASACTEHRVLLADRGEPLVVVLVNRAWADYGVLEQWVEVQHEQSGAVVLHEVAAAAPSVHAGEPWLTHYGGDWAGEWSAREERLAPGTKVLESTGAVRPHLLLSPFFLLSPDGASNEVESPVLAGALGWGGATRLAFAVGLGKAPATAHIWCGHAPTGADYVLDPGEVFSTPHMFWAWSSAGRGGLSRRWHRFVRDCVVRDGDRIRPTVFNNWEATFFDFDEGRLRAMIEAAGRLGAEVFVLDDGWFGDEFPRDSDSRGLGDWVPRPGALPRGIGPLCDAAEAAGLRFGLWVEPEMVNPSSRLYREHPEWVVGEPTRDRRTRRSQLVLDICRADVSDFARSTVLRLVDENPRIAYLKWDANRDISEPGSSALPPHRQGNLWVDTVRARWRLTADVADALPEVELMLCASGGGRTDLGTLESFHEVWLSDNTDAEARLRMQFAAGHFLPPQIIAAHVTRWDGSQDLTFAAAVAMSARFGFDLDPASLTPDEHTMLEAAAAAYRRFRGLVQHGDTYRLVSPHSGDGSHAALLFVGADGAQAVVFAYQLTPQPGMAAVGSAHGTDVRLRLAGLVADATYELRAVDLGKTTSATSLRHGGSELMGTGLAWPLSSPRTAAIWELSALRSADGN